MAAGQGQKTDAQKAKKQRLPVPVLSGKTGPAADEPQRLAGSRVSDASISVSPLFFLLSATVRLAGIPAGGGLAGGQTLVPQRRRTSGLEGPGT